MNGRNIFLSVLALIMIAGLVQGTWTKINLGSTDFTNVPILELLLQYYGWIGVLLVIIGLLLGKKWIQGIGGLLILFAIFFSGTGHWIRNTTSQVSTQLSCKADPSQASCIQVEEQKAELAAELAASEAAAREKARIAQERAHEESRTNAQEKPCLRRHTDQLNCTSVTFGYHTKYDREALKDHCIVADPISALQKIAIGGDQYRFIGANGLVAQFFDLPLGDSIGNFTCKKD